MARPTISYGDILNSMNVKLVNGVLVYNRGDIAPSPSSSPSFSENTTKQVHLSNQPIPDELKRSKIYNKYFSHYKENNEEPEIRQPKTVEEYRQMVTEDKIKRFLAQKRIERVKPKTMLFNNNGSFSQISHFPPMQNNFHFK